LKTGIIIYVTGNAPSKWTEEDENTIRKSLHRAHAVEIITTETGCFDIHDAWMSLLTRGTNHIICKMAAFNESGEFKFTGSELRLCG